MFAVSLPAKPNGKKKNPSIIDMANAAYSMAPSTTNAQKIPRSDVSWSSRSRNNSTSSINLDERLDAARAMLGISPCSVTDASVVSIMGGRGSLKPQRPISSSRSSQSSGDKQCEGSAAGGTNAESPASNGRPRSNSAGLDALAFLATQEQEATTSTTAAKTMASDSPTTVPYSSVSLVAHPAVTSSDDDSEIMPPPPPRAAVTRRRRSVSNPEGMGKWGLPPTRRLRLVLPASILEEEIAEANAAVIAKEKSTASASALAASLLSQQGDIHLSRARSKLPLVEEDDEEDLDHDELLRRARSRLLEDLSQSNLSGEKGVLTLPHSLGKYKEVYNKNGRIGIYTPAERAAIIARFQSKRTRRVWNKKIRYNCRKNLADRRLRVKGRFVKRSAVVPTEEKETPKAPTANESPEKTSKAGVATPTPARSKVPTIPEDTEAPQGDDDTDMPDVSDPDAGFRPTDDQPYRRMRRHTIT